MSAYSFDPAIGGIETVSRLLAVEFVELGHEVKVVTKTLAPDGPSYPFEVIRRPPIRRLIGLLQWADLYFQVHISLLLAWPLIIRRKPWVVSQHTWLNTTGLVGAWRGRLKRYLLRFAETVSISNSIARDMPFPTQVIGNPYDALTFRSMAGVQRHSEIVFVGRLLVEKGAHHILEALVMLRSRGRHYRLTVVGRGPEEDRLRQLVQELRLGGQVDFVGVQTGLKLATTLNSHKVLVVPSLWEEPFGVVALEGCACGCAVVGSDSGGLPEAIGPCGVTIPRGDSQALADEIDRLCSEPALLARYQAAGQAHLAKHTPRAAATAYLRVFESTLAKASHAT